MCQNLSVKFLLIRRNLPVNEWATVPSISSQELSWIILLLLYRNLYSLTYKFVHNYLSKFFLMIFVTMGLYLIGVINFKSSKVDFFIFIFLKYILYWVEQNKPRKIFKLETAECEIYNVKFNSDLNSFFYFSCVFLKTSPFKVWIAM